MTHISGHVREYWEITWSAPNVVLYPDVLSLLLTRTELHTFSTCWSVRVCSPLCHHVAQRRWRPPADGGSCRWVAKDAKHKKPQKSVKWRKSIGCLQVKCSLICSYIQDPLFILYVCSLIYSFFISVLFVLVEIFILPWVADPFNCVQTVAVNAS